MKYGVEMYHSDGITDLDAMRKHAEEILNDKLHPREVLLHRHPKEEACDMAPHPKHEHFLFGTEDLETGPTLETESGLSLSPESGRTWNDEDHDGPGL
jgi:hypothetical protein